MHNTVLVPLLYFMNSGCVLECRETPTSWIPISVPIHFVDGSYMYIQVSSVQEFSSLLLPIPYEGEGGRI